MSLAINAFRTAFLTARASDTEFAIQNNNDAVIRNASAAARIGFAASEYPMQQLEALQQRENNLIARNLSANFQNKMADAELGVLKKQRDKNIAQSFNYFA